AVVRPSAALLGHLPQPRKGLWSRHEPPLPHRTCALEANFRLAGTADEGGHISWPATRDGGGRAGFAGRPEHLAYSAERSERSERVSAEDGWPGSRARLRQGFDDEGGTGLDELATPRRGHAEVGS